MNYLRPASIAAFACLILSVPAQAKQSIEDIKHIIVISMENRSFDNLFGTFPGANGIQNSKVLQTDANGEVYKQLPASTDKRFPGSLPNAPFHMEQYIKINDGHVDPVHRYYQQIEQINGGKMDRFVAVANVGPLVMGYYNGSQLELWKYAQKYTLADNFFHSAYGGSFLNHMWLICACTPYYPEAPAHIRAQLHPDGKLKKDGVVTPDGYVINKIYPSQQPRPANKQPHRYLPPQNMVTIGDRLSEKKISWAWYADGWDDAVEGTPDYSFEFHHQPFVYFKKYAEGTAARAKHLKDGEDLRAALKTGKLPSVAFYKPRGKFSMHPGHPNLINGDRHVGSLLKAIEESPAWPNIAVIITFDENGGYFDHVSPPKGDRWGPASRVPTIIMSPFAKKGYVDSTEYETVSILAFIEKRFGLKPLAERDAKANPLTNAFEFKQ